MDILTAAWEQLVLLLSSPFKHGLVPFVLKFIPYVLFLELPVYFFILMGVIKYDLRRHQDGKRMPPYHPKVSCIVIGYSEGRDIGLSLLSPAEQLYAGQIEILAMIDGAQKTSTPTTPPVNCRIGSIACHGGPCASSPSGSAADGCHRSTPDWNWPRERSF